MYEMGHTCTPTHLVCVTLGEEVMISVSVLFVVAVVWPVLSLLAFALWVYVKYPAIEEGVSAEELDTLSETCKYHPEVVLTLVDVCGEEDSEPHVGCPVCWDDYRYPKEEV